MPAFSALPAIGSRRRKAAVALWRVAAAGVLLWVLLAARTHVGEAVTVLRTANAGTLAWAVVCQLAALLLLSLCYRSALATAGARVPLRRAGGVALRAGALSRLLPGGGAAAAVYAVHRLRRTGVDDGPAVAGVALYGIVTMTALALCVTVLAGTAVAGVGPLLPAAALIAVAPPALRATRTRRWLRGLRTRMASRPSLAMVTAAVDALGSRPLATGPLAVTVVSALGAWAFEVAGLWLAVAGVAQPLPLGAVAMGIGAANAAAAVPHTPGGVGVVEATMTGAFVASGVEAAPALGAVVAYRAVGFWFPAALGLALFLGDRLGVMWRVRIAGRDTA